MQQISIFIIFGLTWPGFEPTIYRARNDHTNHYTTDAIHVKRQSVSNSLYQMGKSYTNVYIAELYQSIW